MTATQRTIAEIIGWPASHDWTPDAINDWLDGQGYTSQMAPTADDLLAWLREHTCPDCLTVYVEARNCVTRDDGYPVCVSCCSLPNGDEWPDIYAPTLLAALEAAVRAVAGGS